MKTLKSTFVDLFCGIGGFRLGMEKNGFKCVWACDIDKYACMIYRKHFGEEGLYEGNIKEVSAKAIPNHDILCAGFPCQSFSIAGKRLGFRDTRGTLFFEICRIARKKQPPILFLENVKGLLNHEKGETFKIILSSLDELGYDAEWQVLNSKDFGVPQNRERVFIIGHLRDRSTPKVFPITLASQTYTETARCIDANYWKGWLDHEQRTMVCLANNGRSYRIYDPKGISPTLPTPCGGHHITKIIDHLKIRRLTPLECERLQGFPDEWTKQGITKDGEIVNISDTQRYKCLGNAVTVNVVEAIAREIKKTILAREQEDL